MAAAANEQRASPNINGDGDGDGDGEINTSPVYCVVVAFSSFSSGWVRDNQVMEMSFLRTCSRRAAATTAPTEAARFFARSARSRGVRARSIPVVTAQSSLFRRGFVSSSCSKERQSPFPSVVPAAQAPLSPRSKGSSKIYGSADDAIADLKDGTTILSSGFGLCGVAGTFFLGSHFVRFVFGASQVVYSYLDRSPSIKRTK